MKHSNHPPIPMPMMFRHPVRRETRVNTADVIRTISGYAIEWGGKYPDGKFGNDFANQFTFLPGAFDASLRRGGDIALTQDLNGIPFARRSDGTLKITSDEVGLLVTATLLNTPRNRELCQHIDAGKVRGWSHKFQAVPSWGQMRSVDGVQLTEFHRADLLELTLVIRKRPRQRVRKTPIFLPSPAEAVFTGHCCCDVGCCDYDNLPNSLFASDGLGNSFELTKIGGGRWGADLTAPWTFCGCSDGAEGTHIEFFCTEETGVYELEFSNPFMTFQVAAAACDPFAWSASLDPTGCGTACTVTITE